MVNIHMPRPIGIVLHEQCDITITLQTAQQLSAYSYSLHILVPLTIGNFSPGFSLSLLISKFYQVVYCSI